MGSPKSKTSPVDAQPPSPKVIKLSSQESSNNGSTDGTSSQKGGVEKAINSATEMMKKQSKSRCDTCHILVEEVRRRGETIEKMARKIQMLEKSLVQRM